MKINFIILILLFFTTSCKKTDENKISETSTTETKFVPKFGEFFFEYDEIEYYKNKIDSIDELESKKGNSKLAKLKYDVILGDEPKKMDNIEFLKSLEKMNFNKYKLDQSKFEEINKIFVEKTVNESIDYSCIATYHDILIFKKQNKTVGIAKICFECFKNQIIGTKANTENFGQDGDYERLEKLLKN